MAAAWLATIVSVNALTVGHGSLDVSLPVISPGDPPLSLSCARILAFSPASLGPSG